MAQIIDTLFLELGITGNFDKEAQEALSKNEELQKAFGKTGKSVSDGGKKVDKLSQSLGKNEKQGKKNLKQAKDLAEAIRFLGKSIVAIGSIVSAGTGIASLAQEAMEANVKLDTFAQNLGASRNVISNWGGAAELAGGSAQGMNASFKTLSDGLNRFAIMGDDSILKFFSALDIMPLEASGKIKDMNALLLELADKFSSMDRVKAFSIAQAMGIDQDTFSLLAKGRSEVQSLLSQQSKLYRSRQQDIETSQKLMASTKMVSQQFDAMKLMIGNAAAPALLKISEVTEKFFNFLMEHEGLVQGFFIGLSGVITAFLIPSLVSAASAAWAFIAPFLPAIIVVAGLAAVFGLLYDDYTKWAEGGDSLFNWGNFIKYIDSSKISVKSLKERFSYLLTGYKSWEDAVNAGKSWLQLKGFLKDGEISVDSILQGFKNLANELIQSILPTLQRVGKTISKLLDGDFEGAWEDMKSLGNDAVDWTTEKAKEAYNSAKDRVTGAIDYLTGHDPNSENSLTQGFKPNGSFYNKDGATGKPRIDENGNLINPRSTLSGGMEILAQAVTHGEGDYNSVNRGLVNGKNLGSYEEDLSTLTINEILERNKLSIKDPRRINAVGRYQIINSTLRDLKEKMGLSGNERFTPEMQDKLFAQLVPSSAKGYIDGKHSNKTQAMTDISKVWASVGVPVAMQGQKRWVDAGESYYAGDGGNKANTKSIQLVSSALDYNRNNRGSKLDSTSPIGGEVVANAYNTSELARNSMINQAQTKNINHNNKTDIVINGGVNVQSSASTITGVASDAMAGLQQGLNIMSFNNGLS